MHIVDARYALLSALILFSTFTPAQEHACTTLNTMLTLPGEGVQTYTRRLNPVDMRVKLGSKEIKNTSVTPRSTPLNIAIVVDAGSGQNRSTWTLTREALRDLIARLSADTKVSLVTFDDQVAAQQSLTTETGSAIKSLTSIVPSKGKESEKTIDEALGAAVSSLGSANPGDLVLLVTARDRGDPGKYKEALNALWKESVRLFVISFDYSGLLAPPPVAVSVILNRPTPLGSLAKLAGGAWIVVENNADPRAIAESAIGAIGDFYIVNAQLDRAITRPEALQIDVKGRAATFYPPVARPCR